MILIHYLLLIGAAVAMFAYVCRLSMMSWRTTSPMILLFHTALAVATVWSGYRGWMGEADLGDGCTVFAALAWIWISFGTWKHGVPDHFTKPADLDEAHWPHVIGRGKQ